VTKHLLLLGALLAGALTPARAQQPAAGSVWAGGALQYHAEHSTTDYAGYSTTLRQRQLAISPVAGYFLTTYLTVGVVADWQRARTWQPILTAVPVGGGPGGVVVSEARATTRSLTLGPQLRYYGFVHDKLAILGQLDGGYLSIRNRQEGLNASEQRQSGGYARLSPGLVYFPAPSVGLEVQLGGLSYQKLPGRDPAWNAGLGLRDLRLGLCFYLRRAAD
jgi:hypothetical protein